MGKLSFNIVGLQEFIISFEDYCVTCEYQAKCKYGKAAPFQVSIDCKEITTALDFKKAEAMEKLGKKHPEWDWDKREQKAKVSKAQIFSKLWNDKVKNLKDDILCMDSRKLDSMLTSQRGEEWWSDFREVMTEIDQECSKIC
ncbi:hypothetical protein NEF87_002792 [Candidatus Lokiarchaeum ossiferum]|uniref:Uncharacterized protein n=1 Tax=Candidatus Lokiarchaeum ossiferum TaxID=2951803 RepID=A0ABY6HVW5_9ARCH|nr:hypothetical protein NEF87_002792 [Candidatus Lokiarchaeum sp. B-35]